jgi:hypothetical protein
MEIDGVYEMIADTFVGKKVSTLTLKTNGTELSGTVLDGKRLTEFSGGTVNGNEINFYAEIKTDIGKVKSYINGTLDGDIITGTNKTQFGPASIIATRIKP